MFSNYLIFWIVYIYFNSVLAYICKCQDKEPEDYELLVRSEGGNVTCLCCYHKTIYHDEFIKFERNNETICRIYATYNSSENQTKYECGRTQHAYYMMILYVTMEDSGEWNCGNLYKSGKVKNIKFKEHTTTSQKTSTRESTKPVTTNQSNNTTPTPKEIDFTHARRSREVNLQLPDSSELRAPSWEITPFIKTEISIISITILSLLLLFLIIFAVFWLTSIVDCLTFSDYDDLEFERKPQVYQELLPSTSGTPSESSHLYQSVHDLRRTLIRIPRPEDTEIIEHQDQLDETSSSDQPFNKNSTPQRLLLDVEKSVKEHKDQKSREKIIDDILNTVSDNIRKVLQENKNTK